MTTDELRQPAPSAGAGAGDPDGNGARAEGRPTTAVHVIPLWQRPRKGGHG
ncbi:hypothetical protein STAFG_7957 [Streptomyces afghaniensis 772]|uniref:Uncharacterized protein n=1 Tax=Streptomyces afghaniensis 772 TaxID=1283301 RepID=S4MHE7_9ACTN|nr:hypothetical protein STAFG_7957 [Streptomyces afghaniensis 772]